MANRQQRKDSIRRRRDLLLDFLGGVCVKCGSKERLEIHHPFGRKWEPSKKGRATRIAIYWREAEAGLVQLLCSSCNKKAGCPPVPGPSPDAATEFPVSDFWSQVDG